MLIARHRAARLQCGRQQLARVLFSDESRFNLSHHDGRIRVFRRRGECFADNCLIERNGFGGGSIMVWGGIAILMHDNTMPHVARIGRQFLNRNNVNGLPWPTVSPDMNPIEHIWDYLGRKVRARGNVHNLRDLENTLIQEWYKIRNVVIRHYVRSMRGRLVACVNSRGGHTRY